MLQFNGNIQQAFPPSIVLYNTTLAAGATVNVSNTYTGTFTIATGIKLNLYFAQTTISSVTNAVTVNIADGYTINLSEINSGEYASTANCLTIEQWLKRAIYMMTGSNDKLLFKANSFTALKCICCPLPAGLSGAVTTAITS